MTLKSQIEREEREESLRLKTELDQRAKDAFTKTAQVAAERKATMLAYEKAQEDAKIQQAAAEKLQQESLNEAKKPKQQQLAQQNAKRYCDVRLIIHSSIAVRWNVGLKYNSLSLSFLCFSHFHTKPVFEDFQLIFFP